MKYIVIVFWILPVFIACNPSEPETYLIPAGYTGRVNIIFNRINGEPPKYENGRRVYNIPTSGILLTQFKDEYGITDHKYYHIRNDGTRLPIRIFQTEYNKDGTTKWSINNPDEMGIFLDGTTGAYGGNG